MVATLVGGCTSGPTNSARPPTSRIATAATASNRAPSSSTRPSPSAASTTPPRAVADPKRAGLVGSGVLAPVPVTYPAQTAGARTVHYAVEIEREIPIDAAAFAAEVHATLTDPRGWQRVDRVAFVAVASAAGASIVVTLATPRTTDALCTPLDTGGWLDCWSRGRAVINSDRWFTGSPNYGSDLTDYRSELINHEVGHGLGHDHVYCPGPGQPAPVMQQQTISLQGCRPNPWPTVTGT
jgi:hypothetical protein